VGHTLKEHISSLKTTKHGSKSMETMLKASPKQQQKQGRQRGKKNRKQSMEERTKARN
jgi:hypothetical protein